MINVVVKDTNEVIGFPETTDKNTIENTIRNDLYGSITTPKPNWYRDRVQPVLEATGMSMFQPKFLTGQVVDVSRETQRERAFLTSYAKEASFGVFDVTQDKFNKEAVDEHKIASFLGSVAGQTQAIFQTAGVAAGAGIIKESANLTKVGQAVVNNAKIGAMYGAMTTNIAEVKRAIKENDAPDLVRVGEAALKDSGLFALYGMTGAAIPSIPVGTAAISGIAYTSSKMEGASEEDALLNAAVMGSFHFIMAERPTKAQKEAVIDNLDNVKADYIKAMNPAIHDAIATRTAQEHTMMIKDEIKDSKIKESQKIDINKWQYGAEPMAAVPGEPIAFYDVRGENLDNAKAHIIFDETDNQPIGYKVILNDGKILQNTQSDQMGGTPYFETMDLAQKATQEYFNKSEPTSEEIIAKTAEDIFDIKPQKVEEKNVKVPEFKNTEEALKFGLENKDNPEILKGLIDARQKILDENKNLYANENATDEQMQEGINKATKAQFYREAIEAAQGKIKPIKIEEPVKPTEKVKPSRPSGEATPPKLYNPEPAKNLDEFKKRLEQLHKFAQSQAILRKPSHGKKFGGLFESIPKEGEIKIAQQSFSPENYVSVLAHELGHAIDYGINGSTRTRKFQVFGKMDDATRKIVHNELLAVTENLVGKEAMAVGIPGDPGYYVRPTELIARFFEKMIASPGNLEALAPTALKQLEQQAIEHPIIAEFLEAARQNIDKGAPKVVLLRDLKQTYEKHLGKRVGDIAFGEEMAYRAMKERGKIEVEKLVDSKFKGVKDAPETLFRSAESIKITKDGIPDFGTRDFVTAKTPEEEMRLIALKYDKMPEPVIIDGIAYPQYARWRYTPEEGKALYDSLSPQGKQLVKDFTAERNEAKDYFNREVIKDVNKINGDIEGWVHHYFEERPETPMMGGMKFKKKTAGVRKHREGNVGYVEDFKKAMTKVLVDLEGEKTFNDFIKRQFARVTEPLADGAQPKPGWIEVQGSLKTGVGLPQDKRATLIDKNTGEKIPIRQVKYQMPREIYERYKLWRGLIDEATTAVRVVNDINRYWRINILTHPGTAATNFISGGVQYSAKILTDFYKEVLTGDLKMPQTRNNISAMIKVLLPKGWMDAPDWVYGGDLSNYYGQFMKQKSPVSGAIDTFGNTALKLFGAYERYWKKVVLTADGVADLKSLGTMTKEGLRLPTKEERELIAELNKNVDLYAYDYDNVPAWLEAHQKSAVGQAIKPFAKYPYKYAKQVLDMVGSAFDGTLPWQDRVAKIMALSTMVGAYAYMSNERKKAQKTPVANLDIEMPARVQTRGRLFITTDENGKELFVRVAKYPFVNLTEAGMQFVNGNFEGSKDAMSDMLGSIGPTAQIGLLAFNYRNKYSQYDPVPVVIGDSLSTFTPGYRILNDVSRMLDPFQRKQETFGQTFTKLIPTTNEALQEKLHGEKRTIRVPVEGEIGGAEGKRTTIDQTLENNWQDILLSMLSGIYINRIDPKVAEAYIIRKTKNLEKKKEKEESVP